MISSINRIKDCIPYGDAREKNGQSSFIFRMSHLNHGDCPPLFLYQYRHASTACERFAKCFSLICSSIQSISSWSTVTLRRGLFSAIKYDLVPSKIINIVVIDTYSIGLNLIGVTTNDKSNSLSASSADPGRHRFHPHGMSDELLGPRPRGSVGFSPALPHAGTEEEDAGGDGHLRPPALEGPRGGPLEGVTA